MKQESLDLLCIAAHPDDAEIWCGGYLALAAAQGYRVGVLDLTKGELSSLGDTRTREKETKRATAELGISLRENLGLPDGGICDDFMPKVVRALRRLRPRLLLLPYWEERHPDHIAASHLCTRAVFFAGLKKYLPTMKPHRVSQVLYYIQRVEREPSFYVDISSVYEKKRKAIAAYHSQTAPVGKTLLSDKLMHPALEARDRIAGSRIGVEFAEGFISQSAISLSDPIELLCSAERQSIQFFR